jgi:two-component system cell cycle sensor histidine kinase/response regulator CckA
VSALPGTEALLAALPQPAALLDGAGRVLTVNPAFRAAVGGALPWRTGELAADLLPEGAAIVAAALGGQPGRAALSRTGLVLAATPCGGGVLLALAPEQDNAADRLAILGRLAGGIAHDFNNLLTVILGAAAAARTADPPPEVLREVLAIDAAAERGAALVRQLLAFARQQVMAPRRVALNETVNEFVGLAPRLLGPGIAIETSLEEPSRLVIVDPVQWSRVLLNLAVNARDAMGGKGRLRITTGRRLVLAGEMVAGEMVPPGRYATIEVADTGPGIPREVLGRIFEPFFTTKLEQGGTGLGLATVQGIVGQFGGRIEAESPAGGGTVFRILLPRAEGAPEPAAPPPDAPAAPPPEPGGPVLLVDDEPSLLRVAAHGLRQAGHEVITAEDAESALEALEGGLRPALLATDVAMPGMDGLALAREARARLPGLPVLLLSGYSALSVAGAPEREGFRYLAKPFTLDALTAAAAEAMARG